MKRYRIGSIAVPWVNFEPPIRGGIYQGHSEVNEPDSDDTDDTSDDWSSSIESHNSSTTSLDSMSGAGLKTQAPSSARSVRVLVQTSSSNTLSAPTARYRSRAIKAQPDDATFRSPEKYIALTEQQEIDDNVRDCPSLDAKTQMEITKKYQALHQRVKDEGFYDCQYTEYGKEIMRYALLFAAFLTCLRTGWYMISACFLGLFWV